MLKFILLLLIMCQLSGCDSEVDGRDTALDKSFSGHSVIEERLVIERKKALLGDLKAQMFVLNWGIDMSTPEYEAEMLRLARLSYIPAVKHAYNLYTGELPTSVKNFKNCSLAKEMFEIMKINSPQTFVRSQDNPVPVKDIQVYCRSSPSS